MKRPNCSHFDLETQALIAKYCQGNGIDVGCGYQHIGACVGIDQVPWGVACNAAGDLSKADWSFDILNLPIKSDTMDFVFASHVLEHVVDQQKAIAEWLRVLKPEGYLVMLIPHIDHCIPPIARRKGLELYHGLNPADIKSMIDAFVEVVSIATLSSKDVFEVVLREW